MSRDKQIEEMACEKCIHSEECKRIFRRAKDNGMWKHTTEEQYFSESACDCQFYADKNIYRKSTDVAGEIFAEIENIVKPIKSIYYGGEKPINLTPNGIGNTVYVVDEQVLTELKKKYTKGLKRGE